ncbi:MAG: diaminopimelate epimerase [Ignavibacteriales bacterium]|nr:diaminopimelate epimerase [Ignavibacteriales bacterium]
MKTTPFLKMNGAGNDFVVIDEASFVELDPSAAFRRALCDRRRGVGADGILVVGRDDDADFSVAFYNADGEPGSMCGNGARCALRFAREVGFVERARVEFLFGSERIVGEIEDVARPAVSLPDPSGVRFGDEIEIEGARLSADFADTGSPHAVFDVREIRDVNGETIYERIEEIDVERIGAILRNHERYGAEGVNVNFVERRGEGLVIRTFERGVEAETLACGTGSAAAAAIRALRENIPSPVSLLTRGGDRLTIHFTRNGDRIARLRLRGPAAINFRGEIDATFIERRH